MEFSRSFKLKKQNGGVLKVENKVYLCIDLKSFYASVECVERGLDPLTTNLAVADPERTEKTICLAISPSMKALGIRNRCRVFEIPGNVEYIMAPPRMKLYMEYSVEIYGIYLNYIAKEDIHVYSIDEAFFDVTHYLSLYHLSAEELAVKIMEDVLQTTGITATTGICIWQKLLWTLRQSIQRITSGILTRNCIKRLCGITGRLRTSGG